MAEAVCASRHICEPPRVLVGSATLLQVDVLITITLEVVALPFRIRGGSQRCPDAQTASAILRSHLLKITPLWGA